MSRTQRLQRSQLVAILSKTERLRTSGLVIQHASLPCLCELSVCQTNVGINACFRNRRQLWAPQTAQKRTSMPTCAHVAPSKMNVQSQRTCQPLDLVSATRKTLGLDHRDEFEQLPSKVLYETWDICSVDIDGVYTIQLRPPGQHRPADSHGL